MQGMIRPMAENLRFSQFIMNLVLADMKHEDAVRRLRGDAGPSIAWVTGHLLHYRHTILGLLGDDGTSPFEQFKNGANDGSGYPKIDALLQSWNETHAKLDAVLEKMTDAELLGNVAVDGKAHDEKTVLESVAFFVWHEAYHIGQLGTLRAHWGYKPTATLAVEASQAS